VRGRRRNFHSTFEMIWVTRLHSKVTILYPSASAANALPDCQMGTTCSFGDGGYVLLALSLARAIRHVRHRVGCLDQPLSTLALSRTRRDLLSPATGKQRSWRKSASTFSVVKAKQDEPRRLAKRAMYACQALRIPCATHHRRSPSESSATRHIFMHEVRF
jgi:hypothetical protein